MGNAEREILEVVLSGTLDKKVSIVIGGERD
jgi:hypothetical protein